MERTQASSFDPLGAVMKFSGREGLLRVRDSKPNTDTEHRVPTESGLQPKPIF